MGFEMKSIRRSQYAHRRPKLKTSQRPRSELGAALERAEMLLRLNPSSGRGGKDLKWQAVGALSRFIARNPQPIWLMIRRWGARDEADTRAAIATCLLEHLLQFHFKEYIGRVERMAKSDPNFADTVSMCWKFGQAQKPANSARLDALIAHAKVRARGARGKPSARALLAALKKMSR